MGTIRNGANGGFRGKAGSVVGSSWREVDYIKGLPKLSSKPATERQLEQRAKFAAAVDFLQPVKQLLNQGFATQKTGKATGYNIALRFALENAVFGTYPDFSIDYSKVVISKGGLGKALGLKIEAIDPGSVTITWMANLNQYNSHADDVAVILAYNSTKRVFIATPVDLTRGKESAAVAIPENFLGDSIEAWIFFTSRDGTTVSTSDYIGSVVIV